MTFECWTDRSVAILAQGGVLMSYAVVPEYSSARILVRAGATLIFPILCYYRRFNYIFTYEQYDHISDQGQCWTIPHTAKGSDDADPT